MRIRVGTDEEHMPRHTVLIMLAVLPLLYAVTSCAAAASGAWREDQRRCMIYLPIKGGRIAIADDEGVLWIDVQLEGGNTDRAEPDRYTIVFDNGAPIDGAPKDGGTGMFDNRLGSYAALAPVFSKAKHMTISIKPMTDPAHALTVNVGNGAKAMAFLKKCEVYWRDYNKKCP
jgi:hypothetical protein